MNTRISKIKSLDIINRWSAAEMEYKKCIKANKKAIRRQRRTLEKQMLRQEVGDM
ncbi:hypothetical protein PZE06_05480 [Robertmurraya sp. DFI.2.37]|uniref:hypothetical protein n=1 Tax=Robertmurraya sp. DFI.2.37 TaxID=3031819 RepID=UPI00177F9D63|nr:hypothetical protein [Robertmurraya sp. DFI.2.37]MDF1507632.1 hypothetical protein [Robertmurraya sp. DFI.2.37]